MKIIGADNYNRDWFTEKLILTNLPDNTAKEIAEILNRDIGGEHWTYFYKAVEDDYVLQVQEA